MATKKERNWLEQRVKSFGFAFMGLGYFFRSEAHARIHLLAATAAIALGFFLELEWNEWLWVLSAIFMVIITEVLNTAVENLLDLVHPEFDERAGRIKDLCAAAVLISAMFALSVAGFVFLPHIIQLFSSW